MTAGFRKALLGGAAFAALSVMAQQASANVITLTFEGLQNLEPIDNYYDGGFGGSGSAPGRAMGSRSGRNPSRLSVIPQGERGISVIRRPRIPWPSSCPARAT